MEQVDRTARLLGRMNAGDERAGEELFTMLYRELRAVAGRLMAGERREHTLQPTALVHEAWLRLAGGEPGPVRDRRHFLRLAARAMRRVLVDHARARGRRKRGDGTPPLPLDESLAFFETGGLDLLALDEALERLGRRDEELLRIVELRYFAGLTIEEVAEVLDRTPRQVRSGWTFARGWLRGELDPSGV